MDEKKKKKGESGLRYAARMARDTRKPTAPPGLPDPDREWKCPGCGWNFNSAHCPDCGIDREWAEKEDASNANATVNARVMDATPRRTFASVFPGSPRAKICDELGANIYGRISFAVSEIDERRFKNAVKELRDVLSFLVTAVPEATEEEKAAAKAGKAEITREPATEDEIERMRRAIERMPDQAPGTFKLAPPSDRTASATGEVR